MKAIQLHVKNKQRKQHSNTYGWQISRLRRKHTQKRSWQCHVFIDTYMHTYFHYEKPAHAMYRDLFSSIKTCKFHWKKMTFFFFFVLFAQNTDRGHTQETPRRGGSNEHPQSALRSKTMKNMYTLPYRGFTK